MKKIFDVLLDADGTPGKLLVNVTEEGVILDLMDEGGEVVATWGAMAQDLADEWVAVLRDRHHP